METKEMVEVRIARQDAKQYPTLPETIPTPAVYEDIGNWIIKAKEKIKNIKEYFKPRKKDAEIAYKNWVSAEKDSLEPFQVFVLHANGIMTAYNVEQEKIRVEKERILQEKARKESEEQQLRDAEQAEKEGNKEEAEAILNEEVHVPPPIVAPSTPKVSGLSMATTWKFKVINASLVPDEYKKIDEIKIGQVVRAMKSKTNINGIEAYPDTKMKGVRT